MRRKSLLFLIFLLFIWILIYGQEEGQALKVGDPAPPFHFEKLMQAPKGFQGTWDELKGKVVVLEFWGTFCLYIS